MKPISPEISQKPHGFTLLELLVTVALLAIVIALTFSVMGNMRERSLAFRCMKNMQQLFIAAQAYASDNGNHYPASGGNVAQGFPPYWCQELKSYLQQEPAANPVSPGGPVYRCPAVKERILLTSYAVTIEGWSWDGYKKRNRNTIANPASTVILGESKVLSGGSAFSAAQWYYRDRIEHRHQGRSNFLFADGHIEQLKVDDLTASMWNGQ